MFYFDNTMLLLVPAILLSFYAQWRVKSSYNKYKNTPLKKSSPGYATAQTILSGNGVNDVRIGKIAGELSDHYDPRTKELRLSEGVYAYSTISSAAIAAHEVGHALQDAKDYQPLRIRNNIVPIVGFSSNFAWLLILAGFMIPRFSIALDIGIMLYSFVVVFQLITLPVEFNASKRALHELETNAILTSDEIPAARQVLSGAALTYVAAATAGVLQLLRLILLRNSGNRR